MPPFNFTATGFATLDTSSGIENLKPQVNSPSLCTLSQAENVRFTSDGGVRRKTGHRLKEDVGSSAKIDDACTMDIFGVSFWRSGTKIYQGKKTDLDNSISYDIGVTRTSGVGDFLFPNERFVFATNTTDDYLRIAVGKLLADADTTNNLIKVDKVLTFITDEWAGTYTGTVYIRGIAVTYDQQLAFTADSGTDTYTTTTNHGLENGVIVRLTTSSALPTGLAIDTDYYVIGKTATTFQLSLTSGGAAINISDNGTGTHKFRANDNYLRGTSGETTAMVEGDIATQTTVDTAAPKGTCIAELDGSTLVGKGTTLFASLPSTIEEPENFYNFNLTEGATAKVMHSDVKCIKTGLRVALIGLSGGIDVATGFELNSGALLTRTISKVHTVPGARCIVEMERDFAVLTSEGRILIATNTDAGFQLIEDPNQRRNFDYPVQGYIQKNKDQSDNSQNFLHYDPVTKELSATILMSTGITEEIICQTDIGAWSVDKAEPFSCKTNLEGSVYAGSDNDDKIYQENEGQTHNGVPYTSRIVTGRLRLGRKGVTGDYLGLSYGGLLSGNGEFAQRILVNDSIMEELITAEDLQSAGLISTSSGVPLGSGTVGAETIGSGGAYTETFSFNYPYEFMSDGEYAQIEFEITDEGTNAEFRYFDLFGETEGELLLNHQ